MNDSIIEIKNLKKSYKQGDLSIDVLKGLSLDVKQGETIAIVGQSGSGKSTLLSMLGGLDHPSEGSIHINKQNITTMEENSLAQFRGKTLGIVFQQFHLMKHLTAVENVSLPLEINGESNPTEKAIDALKLVGLKHRFDHYPHQLSGGEQQRVAIARSFVINPALLLADEPSGNLDSETGNQVMDLLFDLVKTKHMTMILVTHNNSLAKQCHRQYRLEHGTLNLIQ